MISLLGAGSDLNPIRTYNEEMEMSIFDIFTGVLDFLPFTRGFKLIRSTYRTWVVSEFVIDQYMQNLESKEGVLEQAEEISEEEVQRRLDIEKRVQEMNADTDSYIMDDERQTYGGFEDAVARELMWDKINIALGLVSLWLMIKK